MTCSYCILCKTVNALHSLCNLPFLRCLIHNTVNCRLDFTKSLLSRTVQLYVQQNGEGALRKSRKETVECFLFDVFARVWGGGGGGGAINAELKEKVGRKQGISGLGV